MGVAMTGAEDITLTDAFYDDAKELLKKRLCPKRYKHSKSVAKTAVKLAKAYGVDERKARIAGLLHDWDKEYDDAGIRERVGELGISVDEDVYETMPRLLHGTTAAVALKREFPGLADDVVQAIERHTAGDTDMTDLDMVVYIADVIEPERPYKTSEGISEAVGKAGLEELFLMAYKQVFSYLIDHGHRVHPDTVRIWNHYVSRARVPQIQKGNQ